MWLTFPFLNLVFQAGDIQGLLDNRTVGATLYGATPLEKATVVRAGRWEAGQQTCVCVCVPA